MQKLSIRDLAIHGKKILMRVDFNVPIDPQGRITDGSRILATLPSIRYVLEHGGSLILMSHLGRPKGQIIKELSLEPCANRLAELLNQKVIMAPDCIGYRVSNLVEGLKPGQILMLENLRFHPGEEEPNKYPELAKELARLGDAYVNDAFGTAHRYHASTAAITQYFPNKAAAGFLMEKEIHFLGEALESPVRPFQAIIGGAKVSSKIGTLKALLNKVDLLMIGGAMAHTFFKAQGISIGNSRYEEDQVYSAHFLLNESRRTKIPLLLPTDLLVAESLKVGAETKIIEIKQGIPDGWVGVDIGPQTIQHYIQALQNAKTVFWNGPMGVFEIEAFSKGTKAIAVEMARIKATTIIGGGDSLAAVQTAGVADKISHLSTGGGASLEFIEFGALPGIEALSPSLKSNNAYQGV